MRNHANNVTWYKVEVLGEQGLFTDSRVDKGTIPDGWYFYEVRHDDNDWCEPIEIALGVLVNYFGTLITNEPLSLIDGYLYIDAETDWKYSWRNVNTMEGSH